MWMETMEAAGLGMRPSATDARAGVDGHRTRSVFRGPIEAASMFCAGALGLRRFEGSARRCGRRDRERRGRLGDRRGHARHARAALALVHGRAARIVRVFAPQGLAHGVRWRDPHTPRFGRRREPAAQRRGQLRQEARAEARAQQARGRDAAAILRACVRAGCEERGHEGRYEESALHERGGVYS